MEEAKKELKDSTDALAHIQETAGLVKQKQTKSHFDMKFPRMVGNELDAH